MLSQSLQEDFRDFGGRCYEKEIAESMVPRGTAAANTGVKRKFNFYLDYKNPGWSNGRRLEQEFDIQGVRDVNSKSAKFSLRPKMLHRMEYGCGAIDFYYIDKEESPTPYVFPHEDDVEVLRGHCRPEGHIVAIRKNVS